MPDYTIRSEKPERTDGKEDVYFRSDPDAGFTKASDGTREYGHVVEKPGENGNTAYDYVRDAQGNEYINNR